MTCVRFSAGAVTRAKDLLTGSKSAGDGAVNRSSSWPKTMTRTPEIPHRMNTAVAAEIWVVFHFIFAREVASRRRWMASERRPHSCAHVNFYNVDADVLLKAVGDLHSPLIYINKIDIC